MSQSLPFCSTEPSVANSIKTQPYLQDCSTSVHLYGVKGRDRRCHRGGTRRTAAHAAARVSLCPTFQHHCWHFSVHTWRENRQKCWLREDQGDADEVHFKQNKYCPQHHLIFGHPSSGCSVALVLLEVPLNGSMKTLICIWNRIWSCVSPDTDPPLVRKVFYPSMSFILTALSTEPAVFEVFEHNTCWDSSRSHHWSHRRLLSSSHPKWSQNFTLIGSSLPPHWGLSKHIHFLVETPENEGTTS